LSRGFEHERLISNCCW